MARPQSHFLHHITALVLWMVLNGKKKTATSRQKRSSCENMTAKRSKQREEQKQPSRCWITPKSD
jgi:hypothetical protein